MNEQILKELKKLEQSIEKQRKLLKAIDIYANMVYPTEQEMKEMGRWGYEDAT